MRHRNTLNLIGTLLIAILLCSSCGDTKNSDDKNASLVEKENELLKKENELLKKEQELSGTQASETVKAIEPQNNNQPVDNLEYLKKLNGKYPFDAKLLKNSPLTIRLKKLLASRYSFLKETWAVENPIEIKDNIFVASGCQQHNCGNTNFIIVVDFLKDIVYAGIREEEVVKVYSEDGSTNSEIIKWSNDN